MKGRGVSVSDCFGAVLRPPNILVVTGYPMLFELNDANVCPNFCVAETLLGRELNVNTI